VTSRHGRRSRIVFELLLIALGIAVGILAYVVGRTDEDAGAEAAPPRAELMIHGTGDVSLDPGYIPAFGSNGYDWAKRIFYGLGNFVWPSFSAEGSATAVAEVVVRPDGTLRGRLLLATIVSDGHPVLD
jgi:hypothetical protein